MDNNYNNPSSSQPVFNSSLPNATAVLVLGIISIVGCFCYGIVGLICGIIAIVLSRTSIALYRANPSGYTESSYNNLKAGRICAIIGVSLSAVYAVVMIIVFAIYGSMVTNPMFWQNLQHQ